MLIILHCKRFNIILYKAFITTTGWMCCARGTVRSAPIYRLRRQYMDKQRTTVLGPLSLPLAFTASVFSWSISFIGLSEKAKHILFCMHAILISFQQTSLKVWNYFQWINMRQMVWGSLSFITCLNIQFNAGISVILCFNLKFASRFFTLIVLEQCKHLRTHFYQWTKSY